MILSFYFFVLLSKINSPALKIITIWQFFCSLISDINPNMSFKLNLFDNLSKSSKQITIFSKSFFSKNDMHSIMAEPNYGVTSSKILSNLNFLAFFEISDIVRLIR